MRALKIPRYALGQPSCSLARNNLRGCGTVLQRLHVCAKMWQALICLQGALLYTCCVCICYLVLARVIECVQTDRHRTKLCKHHCKDQSQTKLILFQAPEALGWELTSLGHTLTNRSIWQRVLNMLNVLRAVPIACTHGRGFARPAGSSLTPSTSAWMCSSCGGVYFHNPML